MPIVVILPVNQGDFTLGIMAGNNENSSCFDDLIIDMARCRCA